MYRSISLWLPVLAYLATFAKADPGVTFVLDDGVVMHNIGNRDWSTGTHVLYSDAEYEYEFGLSGPGIDGTASVSRSARTPFLHLSSHL